PATVDWKAENKVSPVKKQGTKCGSCWAHAAAAAVESQLLIQTGQALDLSEQECVDCVTESDGCGGGQAYLCLQYIASQGIASEGSYPYKSQNGACNAGPPPVVKIAQAPGYTRLLSNSRQELLKALAEQPVIVSLWADPTFQDFGGGIFHG
ncbi:hypothetical protein CHLNCDRAFT_17664, partial [Chlorella variabilis]